jgi:hypothetical protein
MGGKSNDFGDVATMQGEENRAVVSEQLAANRPDQYTPWGYTNWQQNPGTDAEGNAITEWTQTQGLSPELMDIYNKQVAIQGGRTDIAGMMTGRLGNEFGQTMDWQGLNPMGQVPTAQFTLPEGNIGDPNAFRQRGEDASYNSAMNRVTPQFEEQRRAAEAKMRNQGLGPEDAAWQSQMEGINNGENDARNQAIWGAQAAGRQEAQQNWGQQMGQNQNNYQQALGANNQNFGQSMQGSQYATQIRQQQMTEAMQKRGFSLNEINALLSGQQVNSPQMPNFAQSGQAQPAPIYNAAIDSASANNAANPMNALIGAGGTLGGAAIMSDRRMKTNIQRIGTKGGYPWYSYNLKTDGSAHEGVMSDEIPAKFVVDIGGIDAVNYGALFSD